jgi:hypothetical protein
MIQEILTLFTVIAAAVWLVYFIYKTNFSRKSACDGCVIHKIYQARTGKMKSGAS